MEPLAGTDGPISNLFFLNFYSHYLIGVKGGVLVLVIYTFRKEIDILSAVGIPNSK